LKDYSTLVDPVEFGKFGWRTGEVNMNILVALDASESSDRAIEFIQQRPWLDKDHFLIISVVEADKADVSMASALTKTSEAFFGDCEKILTKARDSVRAALPRNKVETRILTGPVKDTIIDCARDFAADLIVMGSQGRRGINRFIIGSVAEAVLRGAPCSVQIIRKKE
jgi:nucleotide-binding universal stress UspA family protein